MGLLIDHAEAVARGERSSVELVSDAVAAAERLQPALNAFTQIYAHEALAAAADADADVTGDQPLRGVPVAVKDLYDVAGRVTSGCSRAYLDTVPATADAPAVAALRRAGAIVIGKTNMHELAFGATNAFSCYGPTINPWDPARMTGGSSGGSGAAVAARIVGLALGTDTGGSVRIPASFCGVSGLKTTWGLLPLYGVLPMAPTLDTVGPLATDAADLALAFDVLTGVTSSPIGFDSLRVGIARDPFFDDVDAGVVLAVEEAATTLSADVRDVAVAWASEADEAWLPIAVAEFGREHRTLADDPDKLDPSTYAILLAGIATPAEDERRAREHVVAARAAFAEAMRDVDVLVIPSTPFAAPRHEDQTVPAGKIELPVHLGGPSHFTRPVNIVGAPAVALPVGFTAPGLPIGMQLVGRRGDERLLLAAGSAYQAKTDWHTRVPPVHA